MRYNNFKADVIIDDLENNSVARIAELNPKIIGISALSTEHPWLIKKIGLIRKALPKALIIVGGIHAMFYPEDIIKDTLCDLVCHSEGEEVLINVIRESRKDAPDWSAIAGLTFRDNSGLIHTNERAFLVPFNESIIEDRAIYYDRYPQLAEDAVHRFFSSRGCPYRCSFCYNANIHDLFKGKGVYVRQKNADSFIEEIASQVKKYSIKSIFFYDDLFTSNKAWLKQFVSIYKEKIALPFMCTTRANVIDEETAQILAHGGCRTASFGIETGNYRLRKEILNKDITDEDIIRCGFSLHKYNIKAQTANMFCLPTETLLDAHKTIELNIRAQTNFAFSALFMPFPDTKIADFCIAQGFLKPDYSLKDLPYSFLTSSVLNLPEKNKIVNVHRLAFFFIRYPGFYRLFKKIAGITAFSGIYKLIFLLSNFIRHREERGISWFAAFRYAWRMRRSF